MRACIAALCSHARPCRLGVQVAAGQEARLGAQGSAPVSRTDHRHLLSSWEIRENVLVSPKLYVTLKGDIECREALAGGLVRHLERREGLS